MTAKTPRSAARVLKSKGLIPASWDLRKSLTSGQKSWLTKQSRSYREVVAHPERFSNISLKGKKEKARAKAAGFIPTFQGQKALVKTNGGTVKKTSEGITVETPTEIQEWYFASDGDFAEKYRQFYKEKLRPDQYWTFTIGPRRAAESYDSFGKMMFYLTKRQEKWEEEESGPDQSTIGIARVTVKIDFKPGTYRRGKPDA